MLEAALAVSATVLGAASATLPMRALRMSKIPRAALHPPRACFPARRKGQHKSKHFPREGLAVRKTTPAAELQDPMIATVPCSASEELRREDGAGERHTLIPIP